MATTGNCPRTTPALALLLCTTGFLAACSGGGVSSTDTALYVTANQFTVGGSATGLSGSGLVLQNNGGDNLIVSASGTFTFATPLITGDSYNVSVLSQPLAPNQTCVVTNGSGTVAIGNITGVTVTCADKTALTDAIGGTVVGLLGSGLVLQDDLADNLAVSANGNFTFATSLAAGMPFDVTVLSPPINPYQNCAITNGSGTTAAGDVNNVVVSCKTNTNPVFTIGGTITGVSSAYAVVLEDNARDNLTLSANGPFTFATPIPTGSSYNVTASSVAGPQSQTCTFTNATGTVGTSDITNIAIACKANLIVTLSVSGLVGSGLVLQDNGADALAITQNGVTRFATALASGTAYNVTVFQQPQRPTQNCVVNNGTGTITPAANLNISVICSTGSYTIGGSVAGLAGTGLVLQDNGGNSLPVTANGAFVFSAPVASGATYAVTVATQPFAPTQTCAVTGGTGSGTVVAANITTVVVTCTTNTYTVGGSVAGLVGTGLVLQDNGGNSLPVTANGAFVFSAPVASGATYAVTVLTQPSTPTQTCTVTAGTGTVAAANITTVAVTCTTNTYTIGGSTSGLAGTGLVLKDNGGNNLPVTANGAFVFSAPVASGAAYAVTVATQPSTPTQTCTVTAGSGTVVAANITTVVVTCTTNTYTVGGSVAGLLGTGLVLQDNGGDNLPITTNGTFVFATPVASGATYAVTVLTQPSTPTQTCSVAAGTGTVAAANITTVTVTCSTNAYMIGGSTSGLSGTGLVLQDNGGNNLPVTANGAFVFSAAVASGSAYAVTILTQPTGQTCTVTNGSGTVAAANVTTVAVACAASYTVGGTVAGLLSGNSGVTLQDNGGSNQTITASGAFTFLPGLPSGTAYSVTVLSPPTGYYCVVANGSGTIAAANVTTVAVTCGVIGAFLYVPNANDNTISSYYVDQNSGALVPLPGVPVDTGTTPRSIVAGCTIAGTLGSLYVANSGSNDISQYGVNLTTGVIASVGAAVSVAPETTPLYVDSVNSTTPCFPIALDTDGPTGYASSFIEAAGNGTLSAGAGSPFEVFVVGGPTNTNPIAATNLQSGGTPFELIVDENTGSVFMYTVGLISPEVGDLNSAGPPSTGNANALPNAIVVLPSAYISGDPSNGSSAPFVYVANGGQGNISAYNFVFTTFAALNPVGAAVGTLNDPDALATAQFVSASNVYTYYLYVADSGDSTVSAFAINTIPIVGCGACLLGGLTQINADAATSAQIIATGGTTPVALSVVVLPLGSFLYAVNEGSDNVSVFSISATTGALTPVTGSPFPTGAVPSSVAVWPVP
jgi:predicted transcriptional regulator